MKPRHLMIDLETLGLGLEVPIVQIGAVAFQPDTGELADTYQVHVSLGSNMEHGRKPQPDEILWWLKQDEAAREALFLGQLRAVSLRYALEDFGHWIRRTFGYEDSPLVWSHGASFDVAILEHTYRTVHHEAPPWHYRCVRDTRTLFDLAGDSLEAFAGPREGVAHVALADAQHQARAVCNAYRALGLRKDG